MNKKYREARAALWVVATITAIVCLVGAWLIERGAGNIPAIVGNYEAGRLSGALLEEVLTSAHQALRLLLGGLLVFSLLWFWLGCQLAKSRRHP